MDFKIKLKAGYIPARKNMEKEKLEKVICPICGQEEGQVQKPDTRFGYNCPKCENHF